MSNHEDVHNFLISLNQNARLTSLHLKINFRQIDDCDGCFNEQANRRGEPFDFWAQFLFSTDMARSLLKFSVDMELSKNMIEVPSRSLGMVL